MEAEPSMRGARLCAALLLTAALAVPVLSAQQFPVSGKVVDATTGQPIARATVDLTPDLPPIEAGEEAPTAQVAPPPGQSRGRGFRGRNSGTQSPAISALADVTTGADGEFVFPAVPAGRYRLSAARRGYAVAFLDEHGSFYAAVFVGPDTAATGIRVPLQPDAMIEGTVLDSSGDPVETAALTLFRQVDDGTGAIRPARNTSVQQGDSSFAFTDLPPGTYYLSATGRPWYAENQPPSSATAGAPDPLDVVYPTTFYASADSSAGAQPIVLKAGDTAHTDMTLSAVQAVHVQFPIADTPGSFMPPQLTQSAFSGSVTVPVWQTSFVRGEAGQSPVRTVAIAPGTYTLHSDGGESTLEVSAGATIPAVAEQASAISIAGKVAMADGSPLPSGTQLELVPRQDGTEGGTALGNLPFGVGFGGSIRISGLNGGARYRGFPRLHERPVDVVLQPDGSFQANAVQPGDYTLGIAAGDSGPFVITGAAASGAQVSAQFVLHLGTQNAMLAATVVRAGSSIHGVVVDGHGAPEAGVMVLLAPTDSTLPTLYKQEESNSDGSWSIANIPAGAYRVIAIRNGWELPWKNPSVLAPYLAAAVPAQVPAGSELALKRPVAAQNR